MKYYSKSPEEWKKEDEKKNQDDRIAQLRARAWKFFFLNLLIVIGTFIFIGFYLRMSGYPVKFFSRTPGVRGDIKVFISFDGSNGSFALGQPIDVLVYAQNTSKSEKKLVIENFSFKIRDKSDNDLYSFLYSSKVERKIGKFEKVLVFELKREKVINNLKEGEYTAVVDLKLNGSEVTVLKTFKVENKLKLLLSGYQPFFFVGEIPSFNVEIFNENYKKVSVFGKNIRIELKASDDSVVWSKMLKIDQQYDLPAKARCFITEVNSMLRFDKVGLYKINAVLGYKGGELAFSKAFKVIPRNKLSIDDVEVLVESPIYTSIGNTSEINVYLYNKSKEDRFILIKEGELFLQGPEVVLLGSFKNIRVWLVGNGKLSLFDAKHTFHSQGTYKIVAFLQTDNGDLYKELTVKVGGAGE